MKNVKKIAKALGGRSSDLRPFARHFGGGACSRIRTVNIYITEDQKWYQDLREYTVFT